MTEKFTLDLVTPEKLAFSKDIEMVNIPGNEGVFGVLKGHAPVISGIQAGAIEVYNKSSNQKPSERIFVAGGFAEVTEDRCTILANEAINLSYIKKSEAQERLEKSEKDLKKAKNDIERDIASKKVAESTVLVELCA